MTEYDPVRRRANWDRHREEIRLEIHRRRVSFVCAKCFGEFHTPDGLDEATARRFVRLGGKTVCEVCAARKKRRIIGGILPDAIAPGMRYAKG